MSNKVLIIEEHDLNRVLFRDLLRNYGYETFEAKNLKEGRDLLHNEPIDLLLIDIKPNDQEAINLIKWVKTDLLLKDVSVVAITAYAFKNNEIKIKASGVDAYLTKPISIEKFTHTIKQCINNKRRVSPIFFSSMQRASSI